MSIEITISSAEHHVYIFEHEFDIYIGENQIAFNRNECLQGVHCSISWHGDKVIIQRQSQCSEIMLNGINVEPEECICITGNNVIKIFADPIITIHVLEKSGDGKEVTIKDMEDEVRLPFICPWVTSYPYHTAIVAILTAYNQEIQWLFNNYILLWINKTREFQAYWADFKFPRDIAMNKEDYCPFIETQELSRFEKDVIYKIQEHLRQKEYIYLSLNMFYIEQWWDRMANRTHRKHQVLIYGYNEKKKIFYVADFFRGKYSSIQLHYDVFLKAYQELNAVERKSAVEYADNIVFLKYKHVQYEIESSHIKSLIRDYIYSHDFTIKNYLNNEYFEGKIIYGIACLDYLEFYVHECVRDKADIDKRVFHLINLSNNLMLKRYEYMVQTDKAKANTQLVEALQDGVKRGHLLLNLVLKYNITRDEKYEEVIVNKLVELKTQQKSTFASCGEMMY